MKDSKQKKRKYDKRKEDDRNRTLIKIAEKGVPIIVGIGLFAMKKLKR